VRTEDIKVYGVETHGQMLANPAWLRSWPMARCGIQSELLGSRMSLRFVDPIARNRRMGGQRRRLKKSLIDRDPNPVGLFHNAMDLQNISRVPAWQADASSPGGCREKTTNCAESHPVGQVKTDSQSPPPLGMAFRIFEASPNGESNMRDISASASSSSFMHGLAVL
jgi:hypothetical protein